MDAIRALLGQIVDYAGLFPPARFDMATTLANYARHRASPHAWMLGRLIIPAARFEEFVDCLASLGADGPDAARPWHIATLGAPAGDIESWHDSLSHDLFQMEELRGSHQDRLVLDAYERPLPPALILEADARRRDVFIAITQVDAATCGQEKETPISVALELPLTDTCPDVLTACVAALGELNAQAAETGGAQLAIKMRTGGVEAHQFPSPAQVACLLAACATHSVAFKATAGLHHPFRHHNPSVNCLMHGFINLFGAAALLHVAEIDAAGAEAMLADTEPSNFTFDDSGFGWQDHRVSTAEIATAREELALSFGSCSFDEPIEDLLAAHLLEP